MNLWNDVFRKLTIPLLLTLFIALCYEFIGFFGVDPEALAIHPRDSQHWFGIFTVPLVHAGPAHLINNLLSFVVLASLLFLVYYRIAGRVMFLLWTLTGTLMYFFARPEYFHIGASGVVYALIAFLFTAGLFIRRRTPLAIALVVAMYYGGSIWGIFPLEKGVSWDGHLMGVISGVLVAWLFKRKISRDYPEDRKPVWEEEDAEDDEYRKFRD